MNGINDKLDNTGENISEPVVIGSAFIQTETEKKRLKNKKQNQQSLVICGISNDLKYNNLSLRTVKGESSGESF